MTHTENALTKNKSAVILEWLFLFVTGIYLVCQCIHQSTYVLPTYTFPDRPAFQLLLCAAAVLVLGKTILTGLRNVRTIFLVLAAVAAYAAIGMVYAPVWDGEEVREFGMPEIYAEQPYLGEGVNKEELDDITWELVNSVGDDEYAEAWYEYSLDGENTTRSVRTHEKKKVFETYDEFRQYMMNVDYLTMPSWFPEETEYFYAEAVMGLKADSGEEDSFLWQGYGEENEKAHLIEERMEGQVHFRRYSFDEADTIVKGYMIDFGMKEGGRILVQRIRLRERDSFGTRDVPEVYCGLRLLLGAGVSCGRLPV